jgi:hypothetical protein
MYGVKTWSSFQKVVYFDCDIDYPNNLALPHNEQGDCNN